MSEEQSLVVSGDGHYILQCIERYPGVTVIVAFKVVARGELFEGYDVFVVEDALGDKLF